MKPIIFYNKFLLIGENSFEDEDEEDDDDSRTLADKMATFKFIDEMTDVETVDKIADEIASFEFIDDTDIEADDDLTWSPLTENVETMLTPKRRRKSSFTSNSSSLVQSEFDVWNSNHQRNGETLIGIVNIKLNLCDILSTILKILLRC